jgi:hypothetical protein
MTTQRPSTSEERIGQLFSLQRPTGGTLTAIQRSFLQAVAKSGNETEVVRALEELAGKAAGNRNTPPLAKEISETREQGFVSQLAGSLAACWWAYKYEKDDRVLKGLSKAEFRALPDKLDKIAAAIDLVNASCLGNPIRREAESVGRLSRTSFDFPEALEYTREEVLAYYELPGRLRDYADRLRGPYRRFSKAELYEEMLFLPSTSEEKGRTSEKSSDRERDFEEDPASPGRKPDVSDAEENVRLVKATHDGRQGDLARDAEVHLVDLIEERTGGRHLAEAAELLLAVTSGSRGPTEGTGGGLGIDSAGLGTAAI